MNWRKKNKEKEYVLENKKKKSSYFWVIIVAFLVISGLGIYFLTPSQSLNKQISLNLTKDLTNTSSFSFQDNNLVPDKDYTCEEISPLNITAKVLQTQQLVFTDKSKTSNGIRLYGSCENNYELGTNSHQAKCVAGYSSGRRFDDEGIILKQYEVKFHFILDDRKCEVLSSNEVNCEVIDMTCRIVWN